LPIGGRVVTIPLGSLLDALARVPEWRRTGQVGQRHDVLLLLAVCAMIGGARSRYALGRWAQEYGPMLLRPLNLHRARVVAWGDNLEGSQTRMPSISQFDRTFGLLDTKRFENVLSSWVMSQGTPDPASLVFAPDLLDNKHRDRLPGIRQAVAYAQHLLDPVR